MIASIRGKKPHVYRVIILKQMADHIPLDNRMGVVMLVIRWLKLTLPLQITDRNYTSFLSFPRFLPLILMMITMKQ